MNGNRILFAVIVCLAEWTNLLDAGEPGVVTLKGKITSITRESPSGEEVPIQAPAYTLHPDPESQAEMGPSVPLSVTDPKVDHKLLSDLASSGEDAVVTGTRLYVKKTFFLHVRSVRKSKP